jgi:hypothetical protein
MKHEHKVMKMTNVRRSNRLMNVQEVSANPFLRDAETLHVLCGFLFLAVEFMMLVQHAL